MKLILNGDMFAPDGTFIPDSEIECDARFLPMTWRGQHVGCIVKGDFQLENGFTFQKFPPKPKIDPNAAELTGVGTMRPKEYLVYQGYILADDQTLYPVRGSTDLNEKTFYASRDEFDFDETGAVILNDDVFKRQIGDKSKTHRG